MFARNRRLLYTIALFQGMVFYGSIATIYRQASGLTIFQITLIESISLGVMLLLEIPWGYAADRIGYKKTIILCNFVFCLSKLVFWMADSFTAFLAERLLLSFVLSGLSGCESAFLYINAGDRNAKKVFAIHSVMSTFGLLFAAVSFSLFFSSALRLTALLTFVAYTVSLLLSFFLKNASGAAAAQSKPGMTPAALLKTVVKDKRFLCYLVACGFLIETNQTITVFLSQLQYLKSGIPVRLFGYLYLLLTCTGVFAMGSASLGKRFGEPVLALFAGGACLLMFIGMPSYTGVLCILLIRASASLLYPFMEDKKNRQALDTHRATVLSGYSMLMSLIGIFTNLIFGWLANIDIGLAMLFGAALGGAGFLLFLQSRRGQSQND